MRRLVSGPAIACLTLSPRMTVNDRLRARRYGETLRLGGVVYADLHAVERFHGVEFSNDQLARAIDRHPARSIVLPQAATEAP